MLEDSGIEDLHCDELDSSTHSSSDTDTEPVVPPAKRSKAGGKQKRGQSSPFDFSSSYIPVSRNVPQNSQQPGPTNLGDVDNESDVLEIFQLFWTDATWQKFTDMTNLRAEQTLEENANDYYAKLWSPLTVDEMKAFFAVRLSMEYTVIRPRYGIETSGEFCSRPQGIESTLHVIVSLGFGDFFIMLMNSLMTKTTSSTRYVR